MYRKTIFAKAFGASLGLMLLVAAVGVYGGLAFAVPVTQVGGGTYTLHADSITATNAIVYPSSGVGDQPAAVVEFTNSKISGLKITKTVNTPVGKAEVVITSNGPVQTESLLLQSNRIHAEDSSLSGLEILANDQRVGGQFSVSTGATSEELEDRGKTVDLGAKEDGALVLKNFNIETRYIVTNNIGIQGLNVQIKGA